MRIKNFITLSLLIAVACIAGGMLTPATHAADAPAKAADTQSPDDVFKDIGLTRSGFLLVLHDEADIHMAAAAVKSIRVKVTTESASRASLTRQLEINDDVMTKINADLSDKNEQLKRLKDNIAEYNRMVDAYNSELNEWKKRDAVYEEMKKKLEKIPNSKSTCEETEIAASRKADVLMTAYAAITADPAVAAAVVRYNKTAAQPLKFGPSGGCVNDIAFIKKCVGEIEAEGVPVTINGSVPIVEVTINDKKISMVWDSGCSTLLLSAETADELGIHTTNRDPVMRITAADGRTIDCRTVIVPEVRVGPFTAYNVEATIAPKGAKREDDLLGGTFQRHFLCRLDQEASVLHLTPNGVEQTTAAKLATPTAIAGPGGDIFQTKGLTVAGKNLVSLQEADIHKSVLALRGLKTKVASEANARAAMYRAVQAAADIYDELSSELDKLEEGLKKTKGKDDTAYNRFADSYNVTYKQARERWAKLQELRKKLGTMQDSQSAYTQSALASAKKAGATVVAYAQMANDAALKTAVEKYNKSAAQPVALGPSGDFSRDLEFLKQTLTDIANDGVPITIEGGVPNVVVTIGDKNVEMIWDSGASYVSFSAETAAELGLKATDKDPTVKTFVADGKSVESKLIVVPQISVGGYTAYNVQCIIDPPSANRSLDLLGGTFQAQFLCKLDRQAGVLHLTPNDQAQPAVETTQRKQ